MLIQGSTPCLMATITRADKWPAVSREYTPIWGLFPLIQEVAGSSFDRTFKSIHIQSFAVYGLGRQCLEDFLEILTLVENGLHVGAQKLIRGVFERLVVADIIADDPKQAEQFANYHHVNLKKISNRAAEAASGNSGYFADVEDSEAYVRVKDSFTSGRWSTKNLKMLTDEVVAKARSRLGLAAAQSKEQAEAFYLGGADLSSPLIHASMLSIHARVKDLSDQTITFKHAFEDYGALPMTVSYLVIVFETQNRFFRLGLEAELETLNQRVYAALAEHYRWTT